MNSSKSLYYYKLLSKNNEICEEILNNLSELDVNASLCEINEKVDLNDPFHIGEIKILNLPSDFVEAVYCLSEKEFWDCYRYNTFKPFKRLSLLKTYPKTKNPLPRILRINGGYNYQNCIYNNRYHLLYLTRFEILSNLQFINTKESLQIIQKYKDILQIMECQDQEKEYQEKEYQEYYEKSDKEEERIERFKYKCSKYA